jgi:hypothetical protein
MGNTAQSTDVWSGWGSVILVCGVVALVLALVMLVVWQAFCTHRARIELKTQLEIARITHGAALAIEAADATA